MSGAHALETALVKAFFAAGRALPRRAALALGAGLGATAGALGVRRSVARANLALAFPDRAEREREALLRAHYREIGRIALEYARLADDAADERAPISIEGLGNVEALKGRGAILLTGHYGHFELFATVVARINPMCFIVQPLSNPGVDQVVERLRTRAGVRVLSTSGGIKQVFRALRDGQWIAMVADQDARRHGVFVPFFGRPASTAEGPARLALQTGAPIVFGWVRRGPDGRHRAVLEPPRWPEGAADEAGVERLTAWHARRLEDVIRAAPEHWFWLHRRWKTRPPVNTVA